MSTRNLDKLFDPKSIAVIGASNKKGSVGYILLRNLIGAEYEGIVYPVNVSAQSVQGIQAYASISQVPRKIDLADHRRAGQGRARDDARVRRGRRGRRRHRLVRLQGDRRRGQQARGGGRRHRRVLRRAHRRPQLPRLHPPGHEPQRDLRPRDPAGRPRRLLQPVRRPRHRHPRLGRGQPGRLLRLRQRRLHGRRGLRRPHRLLRRRRAHEQHHPLHRVDHRRAQVHERRAPLRQEQADHRRQERPHGAQRAGGRQPHRRHRRRRHALQRRLPPRRRRARRRDRGPVRRQRGAEPRLAARAGRAWASSPTPAAPA